ncbi:MAG TPA: proline iminopeptidase-family hydrolase [Mycobacteriales bacterium]|jgi:L-proline amide hydrolase|nr:proline iminopeptidase-family hydrolase [Mycobacteriales bacterium]
MAAAVTKGYAPFGEWRTWYRVTGDLGAEKAPVVVLHGGPGATHDYLLSVADLAEQGRAVVHYDQLGNGRSTHLPERGAEFWTVELFVRELANLLDHLGIAGRYHVVGQSWGGFLAQEHALTRPPGLRGLVLADTAASFPMFVEAANRLREQLPPGVNETLLKHENAGTTDDPEYAAACQVFYDRHVCRIVPNPPEVAYAFSQIEADPTVYHTMNGPSEFHVIGSIKDWQVLDRLGEIAYPTLIVSGRYDEATPDVVRPLHEGIAGSEWVLFEESSHLPHVEERDRWMAVVGAFLDRCD